MGASQKCNLQIYIYTDHAQNAHNLGCWICNIKHFSIPRCWKLSYNYILNILKLLSQYSLFRYKGLYDFWENQNFIERKALATCKGLNRTIQIISWRVNISIKHLVRKLRYLCQSSASTKPHFVSMALGTLTQFFFYTANSNHVSRCRSLVENFLLLTPEIKYSWIQSWSLSLWSTHALLRSTHQDYQAAIPLSVSMLCHLTFFLLLPSLAPAFVCWFPLPQHTLKSFLSWLILLKQWKTIFFFWGR